MIQVHAEYKCDKCNGSGKVWLRTNHIHSMEYMSCRKCLGAGYLDWIEHAIGKRTPIFFNDYPTFFDISVTITKNRVTMKNCKFIGRYDNNEIDLKHRSGEKISFGSDT